VTHLNAALVSLAAVAGLLSAYGLYGLGRDLVSFLRDRKGPLSHD
jgi:uncharacterized membrane protein YoaK (UPF0700 family)